MKDLSVVIVGGGSVSERSCPHGRDEGASKIALIDIIRRPPKPPLNSPDERAADSLRQMRHPSRPECTPRLMIVSSSPRRHAGQLRCDYRGGRFLRSPTPNGTHPRRQYQSAYHIGRRRRQHAVAEPKNLVRGRIVNLTSVDAFKAHPRTHITRNQGRRVSLTRRSRITSPRMDPGIRSPPAGMARNAPTPLASSRACEGEPPRASAQPQRSPNGVDAGGPRNTYMTGEKIIVSGVTFTLDAICA